MGEQGYLGANAPEEYGGMDAGFLYDVIIIEELSWARAHPLLTLLHCDIVMPYLVLYGTEEQKRRYLPSTIKGERIMGICMSEPDGGSDLAALKTTARREGDEYVLNGSRIFTTQNTQFRIAELATEVEIGQAFLDQLTIAHISGEHVVKEVSMAKWWCTELQKRLTGACLQLHGGYGFMLEYPISSDYADAAASPIGGGTSEIMKVIIARRLGLG